MKRRKTKRPKPAKPGPLNRFGGFSWELTTSQLNQHLNTRLSTELAQHRALNVSMSLSPYQQNLIRIMSEGEILHRSFEEPDLDEVDWLREGF